MKICFALVLMLLMIAGCSKPWVPYDIVQTDGKVIHAEAPPEEPVWAVKLRGVAYKYRANYWVYCYDDKFYGVAWPYGTKYNEYLEDGGRGQWVVTGETQEEASMALAKAIGSPNHWYVAEHRPTANTKTVHRMECPPELRGGEDRP